MTNTAKNAFETQKFEKKLKKKTTNHKYSDMLPELRTPVTSTIELYRATNIDTKNPNLIFNSFPLY